MNCFFEGTALVLLWPIVEPCLLTMWLMWLTWLTWRA